MDASSANAGAVSGSSSSSTLTDTLAVIVREPVAVIVVPDRVPSLD